MSPVPPIHVHCMYIPVSPHQRGLFHQYMYTVCIYQYLLTNEACSTSTCTLYVYTSISSPTRPVPPVHVHCMYIPVSPHQRGLFHQYMYTVCIYQYLLTNEACSTSTCTLYVYTSISSPTRPVPGCLLSHRALTALLASLSYVGSPSRRLRRVNSTDSVPAPDVHVSVDPSAGTPLHRFT